MKKLVIAAGTGFLGQVLVSHFKNQFDTLTVLTRNPIPNQENVHFVYWDAKTLTGWEKELENATVLINLAGKSVDCRYTDSNKKEILASRVDSTAVLNQAVLQCQHPPLHWLNSSTATIYRHATDREMDEERGEIGDDFSMNVAKAWEKTFFSVATPKTIKTALRTSIVLGKNGGAYLPLKNLVKLGFGGKQGDGKQFVSWIHEHDFARAVAYIIENHISGVVNVVAPKPIRNSNFMKKLRQSLSVKTGIPIGASLLRFGATLIGTETELVLKSRNVIPKRLLNHGFEFQFGTLKTALKKL